MCTDAQGDARTDAPNRLPEQTNQCMARLPVEGMTIMSQHAVYAEVATSVERELRSLKKPSKPASR
jgi:hypothetical protein